MRDGTLAQTHFNLGFVYLEQERFEEAAAQITGVLELDPDNVDAYLNLASACLGLSAEERAVTAYERALELMEEKDARRPTLITRLAVLKQTMAAADPDNKSSTQYER